MSLRRLACGLVSPLILTFLAAGALADEGTDYTEWTERLVAATQQRSVAEESLCLIAIGRRWPSFLLDRPRLVEQIVADADLVHPGPAYSDLLQVLYDLRWRRSDGGEESRWWRQLALALLASRHVPQSLDVAAHITDPYDLIAVQADRRYAPIAHAPAVEQDILRAATEELARRQALMARDPRDLAQVLAVGQALLALERDEEVVRLTDAVLHRRDEAPPGVAAYDGEEQALPLILQIRSHALLALGRFDDAVMMLRLATREAGQSDPVSPALELAELLAGLGRPRDALAALPSLTRSTPYTRALAAVVRVKAARELHDAAGVRAALADLEAHARAYPALRQEALLAAGQDDAAARVLVARLKNADLRSDALVSLQDYKVSWLPPREAAWRARQAALRDRPEVQALIAAVGRVGRYPLRAGIAF